MADYYNPNASFQTAVSTPPPSDFTNATTQGGSSVYVGNPSLNPQFSYQPISVTGMQQPTSPYQVPPSPGDPTANYTSAISSIDNIFNDTQPSAAETSTTQAKSLLQSLYERLAGKSASVNADGTINTAGAAASAKNAEFARRGYENTDDAYRRLDSYNKRIQALQKEALAVPLQYEEAIKGGNIEASMSLKPIAREKLRQNTIEALGLSSLAQTVQGDIAGAEKSASQAVENEFLPYQIQLNYLTRTYELNKDQLQREDAQRATKIQAQLTERSRLLQNAQEDKKTIYGMAAAAAKNFPNDPAAQLAIQRAIQTNDLSSAFALIGKYQTDPYATQQAIDQHNLAQAQQAKIYADIQLTKAQREKVLSEMPTAGPTSKAALQNNEALTLAQALRSDVASGKGSAVGASVAKFVPFGQALGLQGNRTAFEAKVNSLKANLTLDNLKLLKGAMSDKDLLFLNAVGSSLDTNMSETEFNGELDRIIEKLQSAGATSISSGGTTQLWGPDGLQYSVPNDQVNAFKAAGGTSVPPSIKSPQPANDAF